MAKHTPEPWEVKIYRKNPDSNPTVGELKEFLCEAVDRTIKHGDSIKDFYVVLCKSEPEDPIFTAIVGNGPTSESNARRIVAAVNACAGIPTESRRKHWKGVAKELFEACEEKSQAHHGDYTKPLEVVWLCMTHHRQYHSKAEGNQ